MRLGVNGEA